MVIGLACTVVASTAMGLAGANRDNAAMVGFSILAIVPGLAIWAMITAFLMELFPTNVRASGYGVAYSLPSLIPAFYAYYIVAMSSSMDYNYTRSSSPPSAARFSSSADSPLATDDTWNWNTSETSAASDGVWCSNASPHPIPRTSV